VQGGRGRLESLDGLRGLAALAIVVLHVWMFDWGDAHRPPKSAADLAIGELRLGVPLFFVLSGFLLHRAFAGAALDGRPAPSLRRYARHRLARVVPAYWLALAGAYAVLHAADHPRIPGLGQLPLFAVFAQNQFEATHGALDPPSWTLGVEMSFYVLLPLAALAVRAIGPRRGGQVALCVALSLAGAALAGVAAAGRWPETVTTSLVAYLGMFAAGMTAAAALHGRRLPRRRALALAAGGCALVLADAVWHARSIGPFGLRAAIGDTPAAAGFALVVGALAAGPLRPRALVCLPARALGELSYGLYLWHFPVIVALRANGEWSPDLGRALASTVIVGLGAATVSRLVVEGAALAWARRRDARTARSARTAPRAARRPRLAYETPG
jgi:peptidoglycan/LPS O-acetylase OafA/YrhL